jgi:ABC-2 type transport system permease protein
MNRRFPVARKTIRDYQGQVIAMAIVAALIGFMDLLIYPAYRDSLKDFQMPDVFKGMIGEGLTITSPEGFVSGEFYSWVPLLFITVGIIAGTGATAGEEAAGTMDILLAQPMSRRRLVLEKAAGISLALVAGMIASSMGFFVAKLFVDFPIGSWRLVETTVATMPIVLLFGALALWAGVTFPSRGIASMVVIGVVVASYFLQLMGPTLGLLRTPQKFSPFYWSEASHVLVNGFDWVRFAGLLAVAAAFLAAALWNFERRDITAGTREWSWRGLFRKNHEPAPSEPPTRTELREA